MIHVRFERAQHGVEILFVPDRREALQQIGGGVGQLRAGIEEGPLRRPAHVHVHDRHAHQDGQREGVAAAQHGAGGEGDAPAREIELHAPGREDIRADDDVERLTDQAADRVHVHVQVGGQEREKALHEEPFVIAAEADRDAGVDQHAIAADLRQHVAVDLAQAVVLHIRAGAFVGVFLLVAALEGALVHAVFELIGNVAILADLLGWHAEVMLLHALAEEFAGFAAPARARHLERFSGAVGHIHQREAFEQLAVGFGFVFLIRFSQGEGDGAFDGDRLAFGVGGAQGERDAQLFAFVAAVELEGEIEEQLAPSIEAADGGAECAAHLGGGPAG